MSVAFASTARNFTTTEYTNKEKKSNIAICAALKISRKTIFNFDYFVDYTDYGDTDMVNYF